MSSGDSWAGRGPGDLVRAWLDASRAGDLVDAAAFFRRAPSALAMAASGLAGRIPAPRLIERGAGVFRIQGENGARFDVGALDAGAPTLTSPQSVHRMRLSEGLSTWRRGPLTYRTSPGVAVEEHLSGAVDRALSRIASVLGPPLPEMTYYALDHAAFDAFLSVEREYSGGRFRQTWSWTDPFSREIVSRDPLDVHEIAHASIGAQPGWPPAVLREGWAELFATPIDWDSARSGPALPLEVLWSTAPGGCAGWYGSAAILVAALWIELGRGAFLDLWNRIDARASVQDLGAAVGLSPADLEERFRVCRDRCVEPGVMRASAGLSWLL